MQRSNVKMCPNVDSWKNRHDTATGTVFMCDRCQAELDQRLADPMLIRGMLKSVMTGPEVAKMRDERENMRVEKDLQDIIAAAHAVAGFPRWLALPAPAQGVML